MTSCKCPKILKRTSYAISLLFGLLFTTACSQKPSNIGTIIPVDIADGFQRSGNIKLSELASDVEIVQFESRKETYFLNPRSLSVGKKYIMIADDGDDKIILFTRDGRFIRNIGRQGKGPGEFYHPWETAMDPKDRFIFVVDGILQKIIKYNTNGDFIKEIRTDTILVGRFAEGVRFLTENEFIVQCRRPQAPCDDYASLLIFDLDLNLIQKVLPRSKNEEFRNFRANINQGNHRFYFWEARMDTLYTIHSNGIINPTHLVYCSKDQENTRVFSVNEYDDYLIINGIRGDDRFSIAYNEKNKQVFGLEHKTQCDTSGTFDSQTIQNDLFGIEPVFIDRYDERLKKYISWVRPDWIQNVYDQECLRNQNVKLPAILERILAIAQDDEASQNMLMILLEPK